MEPLSTALLDAISGAARAIALMLADLAGGDTWGAAITKLSGWTQIGRGRRLAAFEQAIADAVIAFRHEYRGPLSVSRVLSVFEDRTVAGCAFHQTLFEELLFSSRPNRGRLADLYRRQVAFVGLLRQAQPPTWIDLEPALYVLLGQIELAIEDQPRLRGLLLDHAELRALDSARAGAHSADQSTAALLRIESLLAEMATLPRISATITAEAGASINQAPITVMLGEQQSHTIAPLAPAELRALYHHYSEFIRANFGMLDFRGIVQMRNIVRLRLEEVYVPLRASMPQRMTAALPPAPIAPGNAGAAGDLQRRPPGAAGELLLEDIGQLHASPYGIAMHELVRDHPFLVVLGDPGAGKSTLVRMILLDLAEGRGGARFGLNDEWLPIFFPVAAFAEKRGEPGSRDIAPLDYLRGYYCGRQRPDYTPLFERALLAGRALVLLDGLDEVREDRLAIMHCLEDFIHAWDAPGNRFLATSRIAGYEDAPLDDTLFERATVQPFSDDDIRRFAANWSLAFERAGTPGADPTDPELRRRADLRTAGLSSAVFAEKSVTELARNPLLLTILALIHNQGTRLPDRRVDLYQLCVQALAETWNRARSIAGREINVYLGDEKLDERFVVNLLSPAALWIHAESPGGIVEERELERQLTRTLIETDGLSVGKAVRFASDFLRLVNRETGLLQERGHRRYGFLHQTFEEYLAARALVDSAAIADADAEIHRRAVDPGWREVLRLTLASVPQKEAQRLLLHLLDAPTDAATRGRPVVLAGECLLDIGRNGATRRAWDAVIGALLALLSDSTVPVATRLEGGHVLGRLGDPRLLDSRSGDAVGLRLYKGVESYWCALDAGLFWFGDDRVDQSAPVRRDRADPVQPPHFNTAKLARVHLPYGFRMGRYPVSNAEFARFLDANGPRGYDPSQPWWTEEGRRFLGRQGRTVAAPRFWHDAQFNSASQPVVGVSWYEAAAYCRWLTEEGIQQGWLPAGHVIRMPTSLEWERAARHTDIRPFPWGSAAPTPDRANFVDAVVGAPAPAGCFHAGRATCGVDDLVGNVLEWLASTYGDASSLRPHEDFADTSVVLLSYTFYRNELEHMCCGARGAINPNYRGSYGGFRVICAPLLTAGYS